MNILNSVKQQPLFVLFIMPFLLLCIKTGTVEAQVSIAPTSVFMTDRSPFANLVVSNGSDIAQEVSISFRFGYSVGDESGNISMKYDTTEHESSFSENVNAFPRNFVLEPGQRQTVRIAARGFGNKVDGTYWTRIAILASPLSPPIEATTDEIIAARINMNFEQIIPAFFKKGSVTTGLEVREIDFIQDGSQGRFLMDLSRTGNSPFIGSVLVRIYDGNDNEVLDQVSNISTYYDIIRGMNINLSELDPGQYRAEFTFRSERRDVSRNNLIQIEPIQKSKQFRIE